MSTFAQHSDNRSCDNRVRCVSTAVWSCLISALMALPTLAQASTVMIAWNANTDSNIGGYLVFFGTGPGKYDGYVDVGGAAVARNRAFPPTAPVNTFDTYGR